MRRAARAAVATACGLALIAAAPATGATLKPTRHDDPPPNGCKPHNCSLREAVIAANAKPGSQTISLGKGRYRLEIPELPVDPNDSSAGDLDLNGATTIRGRGPKRTTIDGTGTTRILHLGGSLNAYVVRGLALTDGTASGPGGTSGGALITTNVGGQLTLRRVVIADNHAAVGGGLYLPTAAVTIKRSAIKRNVATYGGGIESTAPNLSVRQTTIDRNTAVEGAGMDLRPADLLPETTIAASTISRNTATAKGGGILADGNPFSGADPPEEPVLSVLNSTLAENSADNEAGGVMADNAAAVTLEFTTVVDNVADANETGGGDAGGIYQHSGASFAFNQSVLARNTVGPSGQGPECGGTITGHAVAVEGQGGTVCTFNVSPYANIDPNDRRLGTLARNGGPTKTVMLLPGFIGLGFAFDCPVRDQRGTKRPAEDCDTGAFERVRP